MRTDSVPVGSAQAAFHTAAARDGIILSPAKVPWLNQRGHYSLPIEAEVAINTLEEIFTSLGGRPNEQQAKRSTTLPGDFFHADSGTFVEIDEMQHFTSFRLRTLYLYPGDAPLGFDLHQYRELCQRMAPSADKYRAAKEAVGFGPWGRQRQRAYYDALRDLAIPAMGHPPVIRIPILDGDGETAYARHRGKLLTLLND
jgi:hypothetical protein